MAPEQKIHIELIKNTFDGRPIKESTEDEDFSDQIIDLVGKWRLYAGATKDADPQGKLVLSEWLFLVKNYGEITDLELRHMIDLYAKHELPDLQYFNYVNFCVSFMTEVILAYFDYKNDKLSEILHRADKLKLAAPIVTDEFRAESMGTMFRMVKGTVIDNPNPNLLLYMGLINSVFDYLVRAKLINFTPELTEAARNFAQDIDKKYVNLYARFYCLREFFKEQSIEDKIGLIKVEHFKSGKNERTTN